MAPIIVEAKDVHNPVGLIKTYEHKAIGQIPKQSFQMDGLSLRMMGVDL